MHPLGGPRRAGGRQLRRGTLGPRRAGDQLPPRWSGRQLATEWQTHAAGRGKKHGTRGRWTATGHSRPHLGIWRAGARHSDPSTDPVVRVHSAPRRTWCAGTPVRDAPWSIGGSVAPLCATHPGHSAAQWHPYVGTAWVRRALSGHSPATTVPINQNLSGHSLSTRTHLALLSRGHPTDTEKVATHGYHGLRRATRGRATPSQWISASWSEDVGRGPRVATRGHRAWARCFTQWPLGSHPIKK